MTLLPPFPTDDETLDLLTAGFEQGCPLSVLELLSGYQETHSVPTGQPAPDWADLDEMAVYQGGPLYDWTAVCVALISEVRLLRARLDVVSDSAGVDNKGEQQ